MNIGPSSAGFAAFAFLVFGLTPHLQAQDAAQVSDQVTVPDASGEGASGRLAVNIAAGDNNQQIGDAVIAVGDLALGLETVSQRMNGPAPTDRATEISIGNGAFAGTTGLSSINITAGSQNQMANLAVLAIGNSGAMSDQLLEQSRAPIEPKGGNQNGSLPSNDQIVIGDTAFGDGSGLLQVNLIGGEGNSSANTFALSIASEGSP
ncbi:hypothetical protein [Altererythrobacter sp. ZODW24]|uniref:hypothetical protein n=1 Tax=Altererythrobacter sp. ZODW24 TaxID=2185142 RepID=UPI000DF787DF|nr:hypothetical protein [Altererythrobacter sp. ZODW24]